MKVIPKPILHLFNTVFLFLRGFLVQLQKYYGILWRMVNYFFFLQKSFILSNHSKQTSTGCNGTLRANGAVVKEFHDKSMLSQSKKLSIAFYLLPRSGKKLIGCLRIEDISHV